MVTSGISVALLIYFIIKLTDTLAVPIGSNVNFYFFGDLTAQKSDLHEDEISVYPNPTNGIINLNGLKNESKHFAINLFEIGLRKASF
jgi:hypothetical protein